MYNRNRGQSFPILTAISCGICVVVFLAVNGALSQSTHGATGFALPTETDVYNGAYWWLVASAYVHIEPFHLLFNLYWLWVLGGALERTVGPIRWVLFVVCAAFVSSGLQMLSGSGGIGMSGVGYALFGFGWLTSRRYPEFAAIVTRRTVQLFIGWGILCVVLTYAHVWNIGNYAHFAGFAFGAGVGGAIAQKSERNTYIATIALLTIASTVPLYYNPLSVDWVSLRAYRLAKSGRYEESVPYYRRSLAMGADPEWVWRSLAEVYFKLDRKADSEEAIQRLKEIDPAEGRKIESEFGSPAGK